MNESHIRLVEKARESSLDTGLHNNVYYTVLHEQCMVSWKTETQVTI